MDVDIDDTSCPADAEEALNFARESVDRDTAALLLLMMRCCTAWDASW